MANFDITMPKMGESVIEATITKWLKSEGDTIEEDDSLCELATDKVDSEIPSPVEGILTKILFEEGETVEVGKVIAVIQTEDEDEDEDEGEGEGKDGGEDEGKGEGEGEGKTEGGSKAEEGTSGEPKGKPAGDGHRSSGRHKADQEQASSGKADKKGKSAESEKGKSPFDFSKSDRFYSPLVKSISHKEGVSLEELDSLEGTGRDGRVTKDDLLGYLEQRQEGDHRPAASSSPSPSSGPEASSASQDVPSGPGDEIVEMDRMRKLIADHMVRSRQISPHVTSYHEVDMTRVVQWRNKHKDQFLKQEGVKLTFTPILLESAVQALKDFPGVNGSVDGYKMIFHKAINLGVATALPNGNLIVPVIKNADHMNLTGLASAVSDLAGRARENKLKPDEIQGGTFTVTNLGSFGNITGSPIINQPQVAILALGAIAKKPAVVETPLGDTIAIRHRMILSLSYDHRMVDGALGGRYLAKMAQYLENFDMDRHF